MGTMTLTRGSSAPFWMEVFMLPVVMEMAVLNAGKMPRAGRGGTEPLRNAAGRIE